MPERCAVPIAQELWVPLRVDSAHPEQSEKMLLQVFGRLKAGISIEQAQAEMKTIAELLARDQPDTHANISAHVMPYVEAYTDKDTRAMLHLMFAAVLVFLLMAAANISNLLLVRATSRYQEIAVRLAMGASRGRVTRQLLLENLILTTAGALLGLIMAELAIQLYIYAHSTSAIFTDYWLGSFWVNVRLDPPVLLFVCGLTLLVSLISGIFPAFRASGMNPNEALKEQVRGLPALVAGRFSKILVVLQIALSTALLVGLGLLVRSISNAQNVDIGFDPENLFTAHILPSQRDTDAEDQLRLYEVLRQRLTGLPEARIVALASVVPGNWIPKIPFQVEGRSYVSEADRPSTRWATVSPGYFEAFGLKVLKGRDFTSSDNLDKERVAFVNQRWVDRHFPDGDPLGSRIMLNRLYAENQWMRIVGVVPNMWLGGFYDEDQDGVYVPLNQSPTGGVSLIIKTHGAPLAVTSRVREAAAQVDPDMPVYWPASMKQIIDFGNHSRRLVSTVFVVFGLAALFLAATGLYGILSFLIRLRAQELGLRMALGAGKGDVAGLVLKDTLSQIGLGLILGLGLAASFSGLLRAHLFNVQSRDWISFTLVTIVMLLTGLLAAWPPVRWATRIDPMTVLHDM